MGDLNYYGSIVVFGEQTIFPIQKVSKNTMICKLNYLDKPIKHMKINELDDDTYIEVTEVLDKLAPSDNE